MAGDAGGTHRLTRRGEVRSAGEVSRKKKSAAAGISFHAEMLSTNMHMHSQHLRTHWIQTNMTCLRFQDKQTLLPFSL